LKTNKSTPTGAQNDKEYNIRQQAAGNTTLFKH